MMVTYWLQTLRSNNIVCNLINTWVELWSNFEMTKPHTSPSRASYVVSVATPSDENGRKLPEVHCVWIGYICHGQGIFIGTHSPVRIKLIGVSSWANKYTNSNKLESPILNYIGVNLVGIYWFRYWGSDVPVWQGCVSKILRRNRDTIRPHGRPHQWGHEGRRSLITAQEDKQLIWTVTDNCFISAPRLPVEVIRRFGRKLSVRRIVNRLLATD